MKSGRTHVLMLIVFLLLIAAPMPAQPSTPPATEAAAGSQNTSVPDAPSALRRRASSPPPQARGPIINMEFVKDKHFMLMNSLMFSSSIANAELTTRCLNSGACSAVPVPLRSRKRLYAVGLPADVGVSLLGYYLKRSGRRWWFVPAALVTAGNVVYAVHASQHIR